MWIVVARLLRGGLSVISGGNTAGVCAFVKKIDGSGGFGIRLRGALIDFGRCFIRLLVRDINSPFPKDCG
jgi:hypothetical protein